MKKLIKFCVAFHEHSHYYMAKAMKLKVAEICTYKEDEINNTYGGHVNLELPETKKEFTVSFRLKLLAVSIAPVVPFLLVVFIFYKALMLLICSYSIFTLLLCFPILILCVLMVYCGVRVSKEDWKFFFLILGTLLGIFELTEN